MTNFILGPMAVAAMTGILLLQPAEGRCLWNCTHHVHHHHYARPLVVLAHPRANHAGEHDIGQGSSTAAAAAGPHASAAAQKPRASDAHQPEQKDETKKEGH